MLCPIGRHNRVQLSQNRTDGLPLARASISNNKDKQTAPTTRGSNADSSASPCLPFPLCSQYCRDCLWGSICQQTSVHYAQKLNMSANLPCSHCHINAELLAVIESLRNLNISVSTLKTSIRHRDPRQNNRLSSVALKAAKAGRLSRSFRCCISILPRPIRRLVKIPLLACEPSLSRHKS
jgi:hypothetical protein